MTAKADAAFSGPRLGPAEQLWELGCLSQGIEPRVALHRLLSGLSARISDLRRVGDALLFKVVEATLEFQKDASGVVTAVRLRQGPIDSLAPRVAR